MKNKILKGVYQNGYEKVASSARQGGSSQPLDFQGWLDLLNKLMASDDIDAINIFVLGSGFGEEHISSDLYMAELYSSVPYSVFGVDMAKDEVAQAKKIAEKYGAKRVRFECMDYHCFPVEDGYDEKGINLFVMTAAVGYVTVFRAMLNCLYSKTVKYFLIADSHGHKELRNAIKKYVESIVYVEQYERYTRLLKLFHGNNTENGDIPPAVIYEYSQAYLSGRFNKRPFHRYDMQQFREYTGKLTSFSIFNTVSITCYFNEIYRLF